MRRLLAGGLVLATACGCVSVARAARPAPTVPGGIAAAAFASPTSLLFGDPVSAEVEVLVDPARVDPDTVRVNTRFTPWTPTGLPRVARRSAAGIVTIRYRYSLRCLDEVCLPSLRDAREMVLGRAVVSARRRGKGRAVIAPEFPTLRMSARVSEIDVATSDWRVHDYPLPPVSYRASPGGLAVGLDAIAIVLGLAGIVLIARPLLARVPRIWLRDELASLPPLERALALLKRARRDGEAREQRKALDRLARELRTRGDGELARGARHLAWSEPGPSPSDVDALAGDVEETIEVPR